MGQIKARKIKAKNVAGAQVQGELPPEIVERFLNAPGSIEADEIDADTVAGCQWLRGSEPRTTIALHGEVVALRELVEAALERGLIPRDANSTNLQQSIGAAEDALRQPAPDKPRLLRYLQHVAEVTEQIKQTVANLESMAGPVAKLGALAHGIYTAAQKLFS